MSSLPEHYKSQRWYLGLKQTDERPFNLSESEQIIRRMRMSTLRPPLMITATIILMPVIYFLLEKAIEHSVLMDYQAYALLIAIILIGVSVTVLVSRDDFRESRVLKRDINIGNAYIFEGPASNLVERDKTVKRLIKEDLIKMDSQEQQRLEVLPVSGTVISANGFMPKGWPRSAILETAIFPEKSYVVSSSIESDEISVDPRYEVYQRHMSRGELEELRSNIRRMKRPSGFLIFFLAWFVLALTTLVLESLDGRFYQWLEGYGIQFAVIGAAFMFQCYAYIRILLLARLMTFDLSRRTLKIIRLREEHEDEMEDEYSRISEMLPISFAVWSEEGIPSQWRFSKARPQIG